MFRVLKSVSVAYQQTLAAVLRILTHCELSHFPKLSTIRVIAKFDKPPVIDRRLAMIACVQRLPPRLRIIPVPCCGVLVQMFPKHPTLLRFNPSCYRMDAKKKLRYSRLGTISGASSGESPLLSVLHNAAHAQPDTQVGFPRESRRITSRP